MVSPSSPLEVGNYTPAISSALGRWSGIAVRSAGASVISASTATNDKRIERSATDERDEMDKLIAASKKLGASLAMRGDELVVIEKPGVLA